MTSLSYIYDIQITKKSQYQIKPTPQYPNSKKITKKM